MSISDTLLLPIDIEAHCISEVNIQRDTIETSTVIHVEDTLRISVDINGIVNTHLRWEGNTLQPRTTTSYVNIANTIKGIETKAYVPRATWSSLTYSGETLSSQCFTPLVKLLDKNPSLHNAMNNNTIVSAERYLLPHRVKEWIDTLTIEHGFAARVFTPLQIEELIEKAISLYKKTAPGIHTDSDPVFKLSRGDAFVVYIRVVDADSTDTCNYWKMKVVQCE